MTESLCGQAHIGLPSCSRTQWGRIVRRLAEWSCGQVREIAEREDADQWMASFDGFYLT